MDFIQIISSKKPFLPESFDKWSKPHFSGFRKKEKKKDMIPYLTWKEEDWGFFKLFKNSLHSLNFTVFTYL